MRRIPDGIQEWKWSFTNPGYEQNSTGMTQSVLWDWGQDISFLQGEKEEGECSPFMALPFACSSDCQTKGSYKALLPQKAQNFPGKADQEHLFLWECPSNGSLSSTSQLVGTSPGYIPKRGSCEGILVPRTEPKAVPYTALPCLYRAIHPELFMLCFQPHLFLFYFMKQPRDARPLSKDTFGVSLAAYEVSRTFVYRFLVFFT